MPARNFFTEDPDDHFSRVCEKFRSAGKTAEGIAPEDLNTCVNGASDSCPVQIIKVEES
nr:ferredoxin [uncultured Methanoregula sp.]